MITILIIDDEQHCIDTLLIMLQDQQKYTIYGTAKTVQEGIQKTKALKPDLVFLDVELGIQTGFDYLNAFSTIPFHIIFTTAHENYAVKAFRYSALDYLLKPIDQDDLLEALVKMEDLLTQQKRQERFLTLIHNISYPEAYKRIHIATAEGYFFLETEQILFLKAAINYTDIHMVNGKKVTVTKTLKSFEILLPEHHFYRVHKSYIVNIKHIEAYHKTNGGEVIMNDKTPISVSLRRREHFLKTIFQDQDSD